MQGGLTVRSAVANSLLCNHGLVDWSIVVQQPDSSHHGCRDRQKNSILVQLTVCQKNVANALNSVVIILKNKLQFVTFPFFFMVELQNFLNTPRSLYSTGHIIGQSETKHMWADC